MDISANFRKISKWPRCGILRGRRETDSRENPQQSRITQEPVNLKCIRSVNLKCTGQFYSAHNTSMYSTVAITILLAQSPTALSGLKPRISQ